MKLTNGKSGWIQKSKVAYAVESSKNGGIISFKGASMLIITNYSNAQLDSLIKQYKADDGFYILSDIANEAVKFVVSSLPAC